jgi:hypothetical protein
MTTHSLITEVPPSDIAQLKQGAGEAIADLNTPGWCEQAIRAQHVAVAREIIGTIPVILRVNGPHTFPDGVALMELTRNDFKRAVRMGDEEPSTDNLPEVAAIVFQACNDAGLNPFFAVSNGGMSSDICSIQLPIKTS